MFASSAAHVWIPQGTTVRCPHCGEPLWTNPSDTGARIWLRAKPALAAELYMHGTHKRCKGHYEWRVELAPTPGPDLSEVERLAAELADAVKRARAA